MTTTFCPASGPPVNPNVGQPAFGHYCAQMRGELQALFIRRVREEMDARSLSINAVARAAKSHGHRLGKSTVARILAGEQDPTLEKIVVLSEVFGVPAWFLLTDPSHVEQRVIRQPTMTNVVRLQDPYPSVFGKKDKATQHSAAQRQRPKRRR